MNNDIVPGFDDEKDREEGIKIRLQRVEAVDKCLLYYFDGSLDTYSYYYYWRCLTKTIEAKYIWLIFNCMNLNYISDAVDPVTSTLRALKTQDGDLVIQNMQPRIFEVFKLLGFSKFFTFTNSLDQSIAYFLSDKERPPAFPISFSCLMCSTRLRASKAGRFRCPECKTILMIDESTKVMLS